MELFPFFTADTSDVYVRALSSAMAEPATTVKKAELWVSFRRRLNSLQKSMLTAKTTSGAGRWEGRGKAWGGGGAGAGVGRVSRD